jgi:hypothetical protein
MSSPSEFLTFYRTIRSASTTLAQTSSRCLVTKPAATRPFSSSIPKNRATTNLEDTLMGGGGPPKLGRNLEDTLMGGAGGPPKMGRTLNLEDSILGVGPKVK